jgi:phage baseplate assembly protein W
MPIIDVTRVDPLDLQPNIAIGVSLPFNGPAIFNKTYSTKDQIKSNLINLLLTNKGERIMNPQFGADIKNVLFEGMVGDLISTIRNNVSNAINIFIPQVILDNVNVDYDEDYHTINISINYRLVISGTSDKVTVQFQ